MKTYLKFLSLLALLCFSQLSLAADKKTTLNIYTYASFTADWGPGPKIAKEFEKICNCTVNYISFNDGVSMLTRLKLEHKNTQADIVLGLDNNLITEAASTGLFAQHRLPTKSLETLALPVTWDDKFFVPFDYGWFSFIYHKDHLSNPPTSMDALIKGKYKLLLQDPRTSTPGLGLLLWVRQLYGSNDIKIWRQLRRNIVSYSKSWEESYGLFLKGEADMVLSYNSSPAYHTIIDKDDSYQAAIFSEGHYVQIEVAGKIKHTKQPELTDEFLKFILRRNFQKHIPTNNWMYPSVDGMPIPKAFESLPKPQKTLVFNADEVSESRKNWTKRWLQAQ